jgi:hypothetical protein
VLKIKRIQLLAIILHVRQEKCCKSKTVVDYALSPEGQKIVGEVFRWTNKGCL